MLKAEEYNNQFENYDSLPRIDVGKLKPSKYAGSPVMPEFAPIIPGQTEGMEYSGYVPRENIENPSQFYRQRAENQPWYDQAGAFINQAVVGEVVGGTIMSLGAIAGVPELIHNGLTESEDDFTNSIFQAGKDIADWTKEVTPIYQTGERFSDSGWWFQNGVSVASTLSMLIPGMAVSKSVQALGKAISLGTTVTNLAATGLGALAMRHAENYREANDVFHSTYQLGLQNGKSDEEARKIASDAAALDYGANYANLAFDIIQLGAVLRPLGGLTRNTEVLGKVASKADDLLATPIYESTSRIGRIASRLKDPAKIGLAEMTEGIEEGVNTASQFESQRQAKIDMGILKDDGSSLPERIGQYLGTPEMQDSMLWGMVGGVAFRGIAEATGFGESKHITKTKLNELAGRGERINQYKQQSDAIRNSKLPEDEKLAKLSNVTDNMLQDLAFTASRAGNFDILLAQVKDANFTDTLEKMGVGTKEEITQKLPEITKKLENYEAIYKKHFNNLYESPISQIAKDRLVLRNSNLEAKLSADNEYLGKLRKDYNKLITNDAWYKTNRENNPDIDNAIEQQSLLLAKVSLEAALNDKALDADTKSQISKSIEQVNTRLSQVTTTTPINLHALDKRIISNRAEQIVTEEYTRQLSGYLNELSNPKRIKEDAKEVEATIKEVNKQIQNNKQAAEEAKLRQQEKATQQKVNEQVNVTNDGAQADASDFMDTKPATLEDLEEARSEVPINEEVPAEQPELDYGDTDLEKLLEQAVDVKKPAQVEGVIEQKRQDIEAKYAIDKRFIYDYYKVALKNVGINIDSPSELEASTGIYQEYINAIQEVEDAYKTKLAQLPTLEEVDTATSTTIVENAGYKDGQNKIISDKNIVIEERPGIVIQDKRVNGLAINYLVHSYTVSSSNRGKRTIDVNNANPVGLIASEWTEFNPGTELILTVDKDFKGEVDRYDGDKRVKKQDGTYATDYKTFDEIFAESPENIPVKIQVMRNGNLVTVGYLPTIKWLSAKDDTGKYENLANSEENPAEREIDYVTAVRKQIIKNIDATYKAKVSDKGLGRLISSTERDDNGKRIERPLSTNMPNLLKFEYFSGAFQPFTIYNNGFKIGKDLQFPSYGVAVSEETRQWLEAMGEGAVFTMIPTSAPYMFIPVPTGSIALPKAVVKTLADAIYATATKEGDILKSITQKYSLNLTGDGRMNRLREFMSKFIYFSTEEEVNMIERVEEYDKVRMYFDVTNSTIYYNVSDGKSPRKVNLNLATSKPEQFEAQLNQFEKALGNALLSVRLSQINTSDPFAVPVLAEDGTISFMDSTYNQFLADNITTNLVELTTENGTPVYTTQPVINFDGVEIDETTQATTEESTIPEEELVPEEENSLLQDLNFDDLISITGEVKQGVDYVFEQNPELATIGAKEQYSQYLDTIFPESKVKDIVYHGSPYKFDTFKRKSSTLVPNAVHEGFYFSPDINDAEKYANSIETEFGRNIYSVVLNAISPKSTNLYRDIAHLESDDIEELTQSGYDSIFFQSTKSANNYFKEWMVVNQNQIHILGSQADIQGFREFVQQSDDLISDAQASTIESFSNNFLVKDGDYIYSAEKQRAITRTIASDIYKQLLINDAEGKPLSVAVAFKNTRAKMSSVAPKFRNEGKTSEANELARVVKPEVWNQFERQVIQELGNLKVKITDNNVEDYSEEELAEIEEALDVDVAEANEGLIQKNFEEFASFQMDSKDTAGWRVKLALASVRSRNITFLGLAEYLPFDTVFDDLQNILSEVDGDINAYLTKLKDVAGKNTAKKYLNDVIRLLESTNTSWALKNNFISVFQRMNNNFYLIKYTKGDNGWLLTPIASNRNNVFNKILESWNENFKNSTFVKTENGELVVNKQEAENWKAQFDKVASGDLAGKKQFAREFFLALGMDLPEAAITTLLDAGNIASIKGVNRFGLSGSFEGQFKYSKDGKTPNGLISFLIDALTRNVEGKDGDEDNEKITFNNPFVGEQSEKGAKYLASLAAAYGLKLDTNTHRSVDGKQIYDYSFYTPESNKVRRINQDAVLREQLSKLPFSARSTYLEKISKGMQLDYGHMDGLVPQTTGKRKGVVRSRMSSREQLLTMLGFFQRNENTATYIGLTHSDKTIAPVITFDKTLKDIAKIIPGTLVEGRVTKESINNTQIHNELRKLIMAEVDRIRNARAKKQAGIMTLEDTGVQYFEGSENFYFFPELNELVRDAEGNLMPEMLNNTDILLERVLDTVVETINTTMDEFYTNEFIYKDSKGNYHTAFNTGYVGKAGYGRKAGDNLSSSEANTLAAIAAADFELNYMIHNANMMMLVHGDPALEYKKKGNNLMNNVEATWVEYQKRLAKDVAPGALGHYNWTIASPTSGEIYGRKSLYNVVIAEDIENATETEGYIKNLSAYIGKIARTDAQEWTTTEEHLNILMSYGRINDNTYISMMDKIRSAKDGYYEFSEEELKVILQPLKPVQVWTTVKDDLGVEQSYYIKSSSFPLLPQLTREFGIDNVRMAMERDGVDRIAFKTAVKIGYKKRFWLTEGKTGVIKSDISFKDALIQLGREGFSIQQDIPYEEGKHRIVTISQMNKLLFEGISNLEFDYHGKKTGAQLKAYKERIRIKLMELSAKELYARMGVVMESGSPVIRDITKLIPSIQEEAKSRGWSLKDIESLQVDSDGNVVIPIPLNSSAERIESLILSMFTNTIIKQKINGKSLVQGSSAGFTNNVKTLEEIKDNSGIVFIKGKFDPAKGLTYLGPGDDNTKTKRAQVFIPWKFAGELEQFIDANGYLDLTKVDSKVLQLIGARIPNQGHSSQLAIEVVGFLPKSMGDLVIVPGEITKQMGSDFDVDKLYTYMYNNILSDEGTLKVVPNLLDGGLQLDEEKYRNFINSMYPNIITNRQKVKYYIEKRQEEYERIGGLLDDIFEEELDNPDKAQIKAEVLKSLGLTNEDLALPVNKNQLYRMSLENEYINIHNVVLTHPEVAKKCLQPLDKDDLTTTAENHPIGGKRGNFLSARRQAYDYLSQKAGKDGVGVFSRAVVGATVIQDYDLRLAVVDKKSQEIKDNPFLGFANDEGKPINLVRLSGTGKSAFNGEPRTKIENLIIQQSGAVDNANKPVLGNNNLNMVTFNASIVISMLENNSGKAVDLRYNTSFLKQEIIRDFVKEISNMGDTLNENFTSDRKQVVYDALVAKYTKRAGLPKFTPVGKSFNVAVMNGLLGSEGSADMEYVTDQLELLTHFMTLDKIGTELSEIFTAISTDSKGLGKSYWDSTLRQEQLMRLKDKSTIQGAEELLRDTEAGHIAFNVVAHANEVMSQLFPYTKPIITNIITYLEELGGKTDVSRLDADFRRSVWEGIRMFMVTDPTLDVAGNRKELFYGENSFYNQVMKAKATWGKNNLFIQKLRTVKASKEGNPNLVTYSASQAERTDEADLIKAYTDLFISPNPEIRKFAEDSVKYSYATGGIQKALEFVKYIPVAYMRSTNFASSMRNMIDSFEEADNANFALERLAQQIIQHNPSFAARIPEDMKIGDTVILDSEANSNMKIKIQGKEKFPDYLSKFDKTTRSFKLYKLTDVEGRKFTYTPLPVLGGRGKDLTMFNEYDFTTDSAVSLIPRNNPKGTKPVEITETKDYTPQPSMDKVGVVANPIASEVQASKYVIKAKGKDALKHTLSQFESRRFKPITDLLLASSDALMSNFHLTIDNNLKSKHTGKPSRGEFSPSTGNAIINPKEIEKFQKQLGKELTNDTIERAILHETVHGFTSRLYNAHQANQSLPELTPAVKESFNKIEKLRTVAYNKLTPEEKKIVDALNGKGELVSADDAERGRLIETYYGFVNAKEFISEVMSNEVFQQKLNEMPFTEDKTLLDRAKEFIKKIYNELARVLGVKQDSILEASLIEVMQLVDNIQEVAVELTNPANEVTTGNNPNEYTDHSGGAIGADMKFDEIGREFGMINFKHYWANSKTPGGNTQLTKEQLAEGVLHAKAAAKVLGRAWNDAYANLLGRNWFQVKNSEQVIAIAPLVKSGEKNAKGYTSKTLRTTVDGGTGYAVEMAIANGKEVYVFDTKQNKWFKWSGTEFIVSEVPILKKDFAGIGSRQDNGKMTPESIQAIRDVYAKTFKAKEPITRNLETNYDYAKKVYDQTIEMFKTRIVGKKASEFNTTFNNTIITEKNYKQFLDDKMQYQFSFSGTENYRKNFEAWLSEESISTGIDNGETEAGVQLGKDFFTQILSNYGNTATESMLIGSEDLGMTVGEFLRTLPKDQRAVLRGMIENNEVSFKCK